MALELIKTNTSSGASASAFTANIDDTYKLYIFEFTSINPDTDNTDFQFQVNASGESGYNETAVSTSFSSLHNEADSAEALAYQTSHDNVGTGYNSLAYDVGNDADATIDGVMNLYNPSDGTYVTHWQCRTASKAYNDAVIDKITSGYFNVTTAITEINFKMSSGDFDGIIKMYGVK